MLSAQKAFRKYGKELLFQIGLVGVVLVFYCYEKNRGTGDLVFSLPKFIFLLNYAAGAMLINYVLLPKFLYQKKYLWFTFFSLLILGGVIAIEEAVIEQIFYPDTRGKTFPDIFFNLFATIPIITILVGCKFGWDALYQQSKLEELESAVKESELQFLKSQINPHFLFNNLNNVYAYALEKSPKTPEIILELSGVLRYMLYECKEETVPLEKEVEQLKNFVNLSKLQMEERGEVSLRKPELKSGYRIAPLILSVFIENAFKHSCSSQQKNIFIDIALNWKTKNVLEFTCTNSYTENSNTESLSKGIGLENVRKRLKLLYPERHDLSIRKEKNQFVVTLTLQLDTDQL